MAKLRAALRQDLGGEHQAIRDYGQRIGHTSGRLKASLQEIRHDEEDHARILTRALKRKSIGGLYRRKKESR